MGNSEPQLYYFYQVLVTYGSTYMLVTLSLDRLDAVRNPLSFGQSEHHACHLVSGAWMISIAFSLPAIVLNSQTTIKGVAQCWIELEAWQWRLYITTVCITLFCIPAVIIAFCYILIVIRIWRKPHAHSQSVLCQSDRGPAAKNTYPNPFALDYTSGCKSKRTHRPHNVHFANGPIDFDKKNDDKEPHVSNMTVHVSTNHLGHHVDGDTGTANGCPTMTTPNTPMDQCDHDWLPEECNPPMSSDLHQDTKRTVQMRFSSEGVIPKARIKTIKMTFVIVLAFIVCWCPYFVWDILQVYGFIPTTQQSIAISTFIQSLAPLNSAANPIIFCVFSSKEVAQCIRVRTDRLNRQLAVIRTTGRLIKSHNSILNSSSGTGSSSSGPGTSSRKSDHYSSQDSAGTHSTLVNTARQGQPEDPITDQHLFVSSASAAH